MVGALVVAMLVSGAVLLGLAAEEARKAGVVYSLAYGDQPALTSEMVVRPNPVALTRTPRSTRLRR